jgi:hypothetical protein
MWRRPHLCDACQLARTTIETESNFYLCDACQLTVVITFQEFELPEGFSSDRNFGAAPDVLPEPHW